MAFNPKNLVHLKDRKNIFKQEHPKFWNFFATQWRDLIQEGTVLDVKFTLPNGQVKGARMKMSPNDIKTVDMFLNRTKEKK
ncbi:MAG: hypothetical protein ACOX74_04450 [Lachnospiraceae bacterium]|jgi:hypothetical protein